MVSIEMTDYKIKELNMKDSIKTSGRIKCINREQLSVEFSRDHTIAVATITEHLELAKRPSRFHIELTVEGVFMLDGVETREQKEEAHRKCYSEMFPIAAEMIKYLTANSGMGEGITIQEKPAKTVHFASNPKGKHKKIIDFPT